MWMHCLYKVCQTTIEHIDVVELLVLRLYIDGINKRGESRCVGPLGALGPARGRSPLLPLTSYLQNLYVLPADLAMYMPAGRCATLMVSHRGATLQSMVSSVTYCVDY